MSVIKEELVLRATSRRGRPQETGRGRADGQALRGEGEDGEEKAGEAVRGQAGRRRARSALGKASKALRGQKGVAGSGGLAVTGGSREGASEPAEGGPEGGQERRGGDCDRLTVQRTGTWGAGPMRSEWDRLGPGGGRAPPPEAGGAGASCRWARQRAGGGRWKDERSLPSGASEPTGAAPCRTSWRRRWDPPDFPRGRLALAAQ